MQCDTCLLHYNQSKSLMIIIYYKTIIYASLDLTLFFLPIHRFVLPGSRGSSNPMFWQRVPQPRYSSWQDTALEFQGSWVRIPPE